MKRGHARLGVLLAVLAGLMGTVTPPASATTVKDITFTGAITFGNCPGLGYPFAPPDFKPLDPTLEVKIGPKNEPQLNVKPQGNHCTFTFLSTTCVKTSVGKKTAPLDPCSIVGTGTWWGFCGFGTGVGTFSISLAEGQITTNIKFTDLAGWHLSGGNSQTNIYGTAAITAVAGRCVDKTANGFAVAGALEYKDITEM